MRVRIAYGCFWLYKAAVAGVCARLEKLFDGINVSGEPVEEITSDRGKIRFVVSEFK